MTLIGAMLNFKQMDEEDYLEERAEWLETHGYSDGDVMEDSMGREFVYTFDENGVREEIFIEEVINEE